MVAQIKHLMTQMNYFSIILNLYKLNIVRTIISNVHTTFVKTSVSATVFNLKREEIVGNDIILIQTIANVILYMCKSTSQLTVFERTVPPI